MSDLQQPTDREVIDQIYRELSITRSYLSGAENRLESVRLQVEKYRKELADFHQWFALRLIKLTSIAVVSLACAIVLEKSRKSIR